MTSDTRIVGGVPIEIEVAPYQVSIRSYDQDVNLGFGSGHLCGGILISNSTILTAAHCIVDANNNVREGSYFRIVMGTKRLSNENDSFVTRGARATRHEFYNPFTLQNDIGIIKVNFLLKKS